ncbi:MAG TPA: phage tail assembly chaperone [Candidatus Limnocylindrales bacterium]
MALLSKKDILAADDIRHEDVPVPEWGGTVRVRGLTGAQRSLIEATMVAAKGQAVTVRVDAFQTLRERLVAACLVDEDGKRLFTDVEVKQLGEKSGDVLTRLFNKAQELSGMDQAAVENMAGNSEAAPSGGSGSD